MNGCAQITRKPSLEVALFTLATVLITTHVTFNSCDPYNVLNSEL